jgi:early secretory antigenic target protein ESAT-6
MQLDGLMVDHAGLDRTADDLAGAVSAIGERLERLTHELDPLRASWVGEAQTAYVAAQRRWDGAVRELRDILAHTAQQVRQSNAAYRAADARGARSFGG